MELQNIEKRKDYQKLVSFVESSLEIANTLAIKDEESERKAVELRGVINENMKAGESLRKFLITPYKKWIATIDSKFSFVKDMQSAYRILGAKLVSYQTEKEQKVQKEKEKLLKKMSNGKGVDLSKAVQKMEEIGPVEKRIESGAYKITYREVREVIIEDEAKIPREYLMPDMTKIKQAVLKEGKKVAGTVVEVKKIPVQL